MELRVTKAPHAGLARLRLEAWPRGHASDEYGVQARGWPNSYVGVRMEARPPESKLGDGGPVVFTANGLC